MPATLVIGCQWGDEGKAKIVDYLARDAEYVVRFQGGANAGHTVVVDGTRFAFHLVPAGILYPHATCILAGGMVIDPLALSSELDMLTEKRVDFQGRILISEQAHVVMPYHIRMDRGMEARRGASSIGTTGRGITPAYMDKVGRRGVRMGDFLRPRASFEKLIADRVRENNRAMKALGLPAVPVADTVHALSEVARKIAPFITDTRLVLWSALDRNKRVLCEGAQGTLLDVDHGTYPYVTSSSSSAGGAVTGAGLPPSAIDRVVGIYKAYCTRVGNGPFPTEEKGKTGDLLRKIGNEYGTTTGRPRRCGWFDAVAGRTAARLNGITEIALTKLDVLDPFSAIKVCTGYRSGKKRLHTVPISLETLTRCRPEYEEREGWNRSVARDTELPDKAEAYVARIESLLDCRVSLISMGPERLAVIDRTHKRRPATISP